MEVAKLILEYFKALIWPISVLLLAWIFKPEIRAVREFGRHHFLAESRRTLKIKF